MPLHIKSSVNFCVPRLAIWKLDANALARNTTVLTKKKKEIIAVQLPPLNAQPPTIQPTTLIPAKRTYAQITNTGYTDEYIAHLTNQIKEKDNQIQSLLQMVAQLQAGLITHRISPSSHPKTPTTLKPPTSSNGPFTYARAAATKSESTANYIVITNIAEDATSSDGKILSEKEVAEELLQRIQLPNVEVESAARMGVKKDGSKRPIKVKLRSFDGHQTKLQALR